LHPPQLSLIVTLFAMHAHYFYAHELQAEVADLVEDAVEMRLVADLAHEERLPLAGFQAHALKCGPEALRQAAPDADPVSGRLHLPPLPSDWS
jgi:hypothetical protein